VKSFARKSSVTCASDWQHFKEPRSVDFVEQLPRTETGKLLKLELQQAFNHVDWTLGAVSLRCGLMSTQAPTSGAPGAEREAVAPDVAKPP